MTRTRPADREGIRRADRGGREAYEPLRRRHRDKCAGSLPKAYNADPTSIFGGIVAANRTIDAPTADLLKDIFLEIILAPDFTPEALEILTKKKNIRLLKMGEFGSAKERQSTLAVTTIEGGMIVQESDVHSWTPLT